MIGCNPKNTKEKTQKDSKWLKVRINRPTTRSYMTPPVIVSCLFANRAAIYGWTPWYGRSAKPADCDIIEYIYRMKNKVLVLSGHILRMASKLQKRIDRKHNDPFYSRDRRVVFPVVNVETQKEESWELILSENMKGILETVWNQVHYVEGLMGYGNPLFEWAVKEAEKLDPPEHLSYDILKVTLILRKLLK